VARNETFARQVAADFTKAHMTERERSIAEFAVKVTRAPNACSPADLQQLRDIGLTDKDILSLVQIIGYYNMSTRLFESLSTIDDQNRL
jgi:uncharacterized peroxidase-related enzyme